MKNAKLVNEIVSLLVANNLTFDEMSNVLFDVKDTIRTIVITQPVTFRQDSDHK